MEQSLSLIHIFITGRLRISKKKRCNCTWIPALPMIIWIGYSIVWGEELWLFVCRLCRQVKNEIAWLKAVNLFTLLNIYLSCLMCFYFPVFKFVCVCVRARACVRTPMCTRLIVCSVVLKSLNNFEAVPKYCQISKLINNEQLLCCASLIQNYKYEQCFCMKWNSFPKLLYVLY